MVLSIFTDVCNHPNSKNLGHFDHLKKKFPVLYLLPTSLCLLPSHMKLLIYSLSLQISFSEHFM